MPMIQGIDGNALINAFRQGKEDRFTTDQQAMKMAAMKRDAAKQEQVQGLLGQMFGGQPAGVAAQVAPKPTFDQAFSPQAMDAIQSGETPPDVSAPAAPRQVTPRQPDPNVLNKLAVLDPEMAGKIADVFKTTSETDIKRFQAKNDIMGAAAHYVLTNGKTPEERHALMDVVLPQLVQAGWTPQELGQIDLSDNGLKGYKAVAIDYDKMIDNELANREFMAGKTVPVAPGGSVALVRPTVDDAGNVTGNKAEYIIGGGGDQPAPSGMPSPKSKEEYDALPPGAQFVAPDGTVRQKPGGGASNGTGGFPG